MIIVLLVLACLTPALVFAQGTFAPLANYGGSRLDTFYTAPSGGLPGFLNAVFNIVLSVGAMLAVLQLVRAGYMYMGSDMWSSKGKAKEIIGNAVFGILLLLSIYLILRQINPDILNLNILRNVPTGGLNGARNCTAAEIASGNTGTCILGDMRDPGSLTPQQRQVCAGYTRFEPAQVPSGQFCKDVLGSGWVSIGGDTSCTNTAVPSGSTLCGYNPNLDNATPEQPVSEEKDLGGFSGAGNVPPGSWCFADGAGHYRCFSSQLSCKSSTLDYSGNPTCSQF